MKEKIKLFMAGVLFMVFLAFPAVVFAVPSTVNYQGYLTDDSGVPVSGTISMTFKIYDTATHGTLKWSETQDVEVNNGVYSVQLGGIGAGRSPLNEGVFTGEDRYLEVEIDGTPLSPRLPFTSNAYAIRAGVANSVASSAVSTEMVADGAITAAKISVPLTLANSQTHVTLAGATYGVYGEHDSSGGFGYLGYGTYGVYGYHNTDKGVYGNSGNGTGVFGNSISGYGVYGYAPTGVFGYSSVIDGKGVLGYSEGDNGYGVNGINPDGGIGVYGGSGSGTGVYGESEGVSGYGVFARGPTGVFGLGTIVNGTGVSGTSSGDNGDGVYGINTGGGNGVYGGSISGAGVYGTSTGSEGFGVYGVGPTGIYGDTSIINGTGVSGYAFGEAGKGLYGENDDGVGVYGKGVTGVYGYGFINGAGVTGYSTGSDGRAVFGYNPSVGGYAGYFIGDVSADSYRYRGERTHYENISPAEFVAGAGSSHIWYGSYSFGIATADGGGWIEANAPVNLPQGATITELKCGYLDDNASGDFQVYVYLYRADPFSTASDEMAQLTWTSSGSNASVLTVTDDTISNATIDNGSYSYTLVLQMMTTGVQLTSYVEFKGCRIAYTVDTVAP